MLRVKMGVFLQVPGSIVFFWSLEISLYLELFCFLSLFLFFYVISALVPADDAEDVHCCRYRAKLKKLPAETNIIVSSCLASV